MPLITPTKPRTRREVWSWLLYDFANTIFSMNILTMYFAQWVVIDQARGDLWYAVPYSISMVLAAVTMPVLGAVSDLLGNRKRFLINLSLVCIGAVLAIGILARLFDPGPGLLLTCLVLFVFANASYEGGIVFYNALLPGIAGSHNMGKISGWGVALGYAGAIFGLILVLPFVEGNIFGLDVPFLSGWGRSGAFIPTALLFLIFALPLFLWVRERTEDAPGHTGRGLLRTSFLRVWDGIRQTKKYPGVLRFLVADYFFEDAIATIIIFMAIYTEKAMGFSDQEKTLLFIVSTISAVGGSIFWGWLTDRFGAKRALGFAVAGWIITLLIAAGISDKMVFWFLGSCVGVFLGAVWTSSRALLVGLVPGNVVGQFFGLYSLSGRAAAIIGPLVWGTVVTVFATGSAAGDALVSLVRSLGVSTSPAILASLNYRLAVVILAGIMLLGLIIFRRIPDRRPNQL
jgi:UMF1 family MFS transporter